MKSDILLSICISTYNRAGILEKTLETLTNDQDFTSNIEVIIGDNGSNDNTQEVCIRYSQKYNNIKWFKNNKNINVYNFTKVLSMASGLYVKFFNDTQRPKPGTLGFIKNQILKYKDSNVDLYFANAGGLVKKGVFHCKRPESLMKVLSFYTTWSGNFGSFKKYFDEIPNKDRGADMLFCQADWVYGSSVKREIIVFCDDFYEVEKTMKKDNYNFIKTFTGNYFKTLDLNLGWSWMREFDKYRIFTKHLVPYMYFFFVAKDGYTYNKSGAWSQLFRYYWYYPYTYFYIPFYFLTKYIINKLRIK